LPGSLLACRQCCSFIQTKHRLRRNSLLGIDLRPSAMADDQVFVRRSGRPGPEMRGRRCLDRQSKDRGLCKYNNKTQRNKVRIEGNEGMIDNGCSYITRSSGGKSCPYTTVRHTLDLTVSTSASGDEVSTVHWAGCHWAVVSNAEGVMLVFRTLAVQWTT
jgi:hypothetical protein